MQLTTNAKKVLENRILRKDESGNVVETPEEMVARVAHAVADEETELTNKFDWENKFIGIMDNLYFLPNSPCLANAGTDMPQLQACFVLPIEDSMDSIFGTLKDMATVFKSGGGVGFALSRLRPKGDIVHSTNGVSSGPISFLEPYNAAINAVKQGGRRRGAGLACINVNHPDILEFIDCKKDNNKFNNFNISVLVTDKFMQAVKEGKGLDLINPRNCEIVKTVPAKMIWDRLVDGAHRNGEPGIIFIDTVNKSNPLPELGDIEAVNACSEFHGLPYESCDLGSINLSKMVKYDIASLKTVDCMVDWDLLERTVRIATRFLDNVLDATEYPLEQIREMSLGNRKIGLGVMGWGDMLLKLGIPYNSEEALDLAWDIMSAIDEKAFATSLELAEEKGVFPNYEKSLTFQKKVGEVRNASKTSIAPTGTLSAIAGCTSGIEPAYGLVYTKNVMDGTILYEVNPVFEEELKNRDIYSEKLLQKIADNKGSCQGIAEVPEDMQKVFVVAHDISPEWHVKMQAEFQKNVDMGISKSINARNDSTKEDVGKAFMQAWESSCKGITYYRDGSRDNQVLSTGNTKEEPIKVKVEVRKRPVETFGITTALKTGCGKLYATVNEDDEGICEIFLNQKDGNSCRVAYNNALAMVISMALRAGVPIKDISKALRGQSCGQPVWEKGKLIFSCPDAIGRLLDSEREFHELKQGIDVLTEKEQLAISKKRCSSCGGELINQGGCEVCRDCGMERCGG